MSQLVITTESSAWSRGWNNGWQSPKTKWSWPSKSKVYVGDLSLHR